MGLDVLKVVAVEQILDTLVLFRRQRDVLDLCEDRVFIRDFVAPFVPISPQNGPELLVLLGEPLDWHDRQDVLGK